MGGRGRGRGGLGAARAGLTGATLRRAMLEVADLRRVAGWALVVGLCISAAVAIVALLTDTWTDTSWRVVGTSLGFSVFTSTAAAGAALRLRPQGWAQVLAVITIGSSAAALLTLLLALWTDGDDWTWRAWGVAGLAALWSSHASLTLRALRSDDSKAIHRLTLVSVVTLGIDTSIGMLAVLGTFEDVDSDPITRGLAVLLVITLLSTALPPLLRRLQRTPEAASAASAFGTPSRAGGLAVEVAEVAARLDAMDLPPRAQAEVARLRELARSAGA
jgi:hypothetical protein